MLLAAQSGPRIWVRSIPDPEADSPPEPAIVEWLADHLLDWEVSFDRKQLETFTLEIEFDRGGFGFEPEMLELIGSKIIRTTDNPGRQRVHACLTRPVSGASLAVFGEADLRDWGAVERVMADIAQTGNGVSRSDDEGRTAISNGRFPLRFDQREWAAWVGGEALYELVANYRTDTEAGQQGTAIPSTSGTTTTGACRPASPSRSPAPRIRVGGPF